MIIYWFIQERRGGVPKIYFKGQQIAGSIVPLGVSLRGARTLPESLVRWPGSIARAWVRLRDQYRWGGQLRRDQAPARRKSWALRGADVNVVIQITDCCLATGRIVKQIIRVPVTVKVGGSH
jgi:hypothetical protein